jgi:hypothetical protein
VQQVKGAGEATEQRKRFEHIGKFWNPKLTDYASYHKEVYINGKTRITGF